MPVKKFKITYDTGECELVAYISAASQYDAKHRFYRMHPDCEILSVIDTEPCHGCTERNVANGHNCHSDCPRYNRIRADQDKRNAITKKAKAESIAVLDVKTKRK